MTENKLIYDNFFKLLENLFDSKIYSLNKICGSNQRTALKASVYKQSIKKLVCLRHLIVSLKTSISF